VRRAKRTPLRPEPHVASPADLDVGADLAAYEWDRQAKVLAAKRPGLATFVVLSSVEYAAALTAAEARGREAALEDAATYLEGRAHEEERHSASWVEDYASDIRSLDADKKARALRASKGGDRG
jgi:hypothetical protein